MRERPPVRDWSLRRDRDATDLGSTESKQNPKPPRGMPKRSRSSDNKGHSQQPIATETDQRASAFGKHTQGYFSLSSDGLDIGGGGHTRVIPENVRGKTMREIVETNWEDTTLLFQLLTSSKKATVIFNETIIDGSFWSSPNPDYGELLCVNSNIVFVAAGKCEQVFCALM